MPRKSVNKSTKEESSASSVRQPLLAPRPEASDAATAARIAATTTDSEDQQLSVDLIVILVFITHGCMNAMLLSPWNALRCSYWQKDCDPDEEWILNWLSYGLFHTHMLLAALAVSATGNAILEQRLLVSIVALAVAVLSSGLFMLDELNKAMAALQAFIYCGLLLYTAYHYSTKHVDASPSTVYALTNLSELRSSSFDARRKLPIATVAVFVQFALSAVRVYDMTFGTGRDSYLGDSSGVIYKSISSAAVAQMLFSTLILAMSIVAATAQQQKVLLTAQAAMLFISMVMMATSQGAAIEETQRQAGVVGTFFALVLAFVGAV
jgi:hypothetical protein